jgi:hypothetical protein
MDQADGEVDEQGSADDTADTITAVGDKTGGNRGGKRKKGGRGGKFGKKAKQPSTKVAVKKDEASSAPTEVDMSTMSVEELCSTYNLHDVDPQFADDEYTSIMASKVRVVCAQLLANTNAAIQFTCETTSHARQSQGDNGANQCVDGGQMARVPNRGEHEIVTVRAHGHADRSTQRWVGSFHWAPCLSQSINNN